MNNIDLEIKKLRKKNDELTKEMQQCLKEVENRNHDKFIKQFDLIKTIASVQNTSAQGRNNTLFENCQLFMELFKCYDKYYKFDIEMNQIINHQFQNEKIGQRILMQMYEDLGQRPAVFGLLYPYQIKTVNNRQFAFSVQNMQSKKLFEVNNEFEERECTARTSQLSDKVYDAYQKYNIMYDSLGKLKERRIDI